MRKNRFFALALALLLLLQAAPISAFAALDGESAPALEPVEEAPVLTVEAEPGPGEEDPAEEPAPLQTAPEPADPSLDGDDTHQLRITVTALVVDDPTGEHPFPGVPEDMTVTVKGRQTERPFAPVTLTLADFEGPVERTDTGVELLEYTCTLSDVPYGNYTVYADLSTARVTSYPLSIYNWFYDDQSDSVYRDVSLTAEYGGWADLFIEYRYEISYNPMAVVKYDEAAEEDLPGATFGLYAPDGTLIRTYESDENGRFLIDPADPALADYLPADPRYSYPYANWEFCPSGQDRGVVWLTLKELEAPAGYLPSTAEYPVAIWFGPWKKVEGSQQQPILPYQPGQQHQQQPHQQQQQTQQNYYEEQGLYGYWVGSPEAFRMSPMPELCVPNTPETALAPLEIVKRVYVEEDPEHPFPGANPDTAFTVKGGSATFTPITLTLADFEGPVEKQGENGDAWQEYTHTVYVPANREYYVYEDMNTACVDFTDDPDAVPMSGYYAYPDGMAVADGIAFKRVYVSGDANDGPTRVELVNRYGYWTVGYGKMPVRKIDGAAQELTLLPNARFGLYAPDGTLIREYTSDENGVLVIDTADEALAAYLPAAACFGPEYRKQHPYGEEIPEDDPNVVHLTLKELEAPAGYLPSTAEYPVDIWLGMGPVRVIGGAPFDIAPPVFLQQPIIGGTIFSAADGALGAANGPLHVQQQQILQQVQQQPQQQPGDPVLCPPYSYYIDSPDATYTPYPQLDVPNTPAADVAQLKIVKRVECFHDDQTGKVTFPGANPNTAFTITGPEAFAPVTLTLADFGEPVEMSEEIPVWDFAGNPTVVTRTWLEYTYTLDNVPYGDYRVAEDRESAQVEEYLLGAYYLYGYYDENGRFVPNTYLVQWWDGSYVARTADYVTVSGEAAGPFYIVVNNSYDYWLHYQSMPVYKIDGSVVPERRLLPGATFGLYAPDGTLIREYTSDENGMFIIDTLDPALAPYLPKIMGDTVELTLRELEAPEGYLPSTEDYPVILGLDYGLGGSIAQQQPIPGTFYQQPIIGGALFSVADGTLGAADGLQQAAPQGAEAQPQTAPDPDILPPFDPEVYQGYGAYYTVWSPYKYWVSQDESWGFYVPNSPEAYGRLTIVKTVEVWDGWQEQQQYGETIPNDRLSLITGHLDETAFTVTGPAAYGVRQVTLEGVTPVVTTETLDNGVTRTTYTFTKVLSNLPAGEYRVAETYAPSAPAVVGFTMIWSDQGARLYPRCPVEQWSDAPAVPVTVEKGGIAQVDVRNDYRNRLGEVRYWGMTVDKLDGDTARTLPGATFAVYAPDGTELHRFTSTEDSYVIDPRAEWLAPLLPTEPYANSYDGSEEGPGYVVLTLKELDPPAGYVGSNAEYKLTLMLEMVCMDGQAQGASWYETSWKNYNGRFALNYRIYYGIPGGVAHDSLFVPNLKPEKITTGGLRLTKRILVLGDDEMNAFTAPDIAFLITGPDLFGSRTVKLAEFTRAGRETEVIRDPQTGAYEEYVFDVYAYELPDVPTGTYSVAEDLDSAFVLGFDRPVGIYRQIPDFYVGGRLVQQVYPVTIDGRMNPACDAEVTDAAQAAEVEIWNVYHSMIGQITHSGMTVSKVDENGDALSGATFTLYSGDTAIMTFEGGEFDITTALEQLKDYLPTAEGEDGVVELTLKETAAPEGYLLSEREYPIYIGMSCWWSYKNNQRDVAHITYLIWTTDELGLKIQKLEIPNEPAPEDPEPAEPLYPLVITLTGRGAEIPEDAYVTVTGPNGYMRKIYYSEFDGDGAYTLMVPAGDYTIMENEPSARVTGYRLTISGQSGTIVTVTENGGRADIRNEYQKSSGGDDPTPPRPDPTEPTNPVTPILNTEDHYAYIIGYPDGTVRPEGTITRAETVTIFFRMLTDESRAAVWSTANSFTDVKAADWFNNAISTMANAGIVTGYPDGSFNPNGKITRAEFAAMAVRFFQDAKVGPARFSDTIGHWAEEAINKAQTQGLITGYPDGTFRPDEPITRAEAMTIMNRVLKRAPHKDHLLPERYMITFADNMDRSKWYYADVQEATNSHTYSMNGSFEEWEELLPIRDWAAFEQMWSSANSAKNPGDVIGG